MISSGIVCREFIGRAIELDFLVERAVRVAPTRGTSILVKGSAGIGKTRLVHEFVDACAKRGLRAFAATCSAFGDGPYAPILMLADDLGLDGIAEIMRSGDRPDGTNARAERARRFQKCAQAFAGAAAAAPYILVIDDLHWADPGSLELFAHLMTALREHAVVLVASSRGDDERMDAVTSRLFDAIERDADATLTLSALAPPEIKALITSAIRQDGRRLSAVLLDEISSLADGRPFHAEELLRSVLDRDPASAGGAPAVPRSLRAAVGERLAEFTADERVLLAHAAVIGRRFSLSLLHELLEMDERAILPILRKARNAQLIVEGDGDTFSFRHALTREVIYDEILRSEARRVHHRLAHALIGRAPEAERTAIAYHAWRSGDAELTEEWNIRCGDHDAAMYAHVDAIKHYDRAYAAARSRDVRTTLAARIADAYYAVGELSATTTWYERAASDARDGADPDAAHRFLLESARAQFESGAYEEGIASALAVVEALAGRDDPLRFQAETAAASLLGAMGRAREALVHLDRARGLVCEPEPRWAARHHGISAQALHAIGRIEESLLAFERAESAARASDDRDLLLRTLYNFANLKLSCGDPLGALRPLEAGVIAARESASVRHLAWLLESIALARILVGDLTAAENAYEEAIRIDHGLAPVRHWLAAIGTRLGTLRGDDAFVRRTGIEAIVADAIDTASDYSIGPITGAFLLWRQARGLRDDDLAERAIARLERAPDVEWSVAWFAAAAARFSPPLAARARAVVAAASRSPHLRSAHADLALLDARIALRERRREAADALAKDAVDRFKTLGFPVEEAYARELRGGVNDAVGIFRRIGAHAEVARLTTVDEQAPRKRGETTLTPREREIATRIVAGKTNREVAEDLVISERTVETHVASIYGKLGVANRKALVALLKPSG